MSYSRPDSSDPPWKYSFWPKTNGNVNGKRIIIFLANCPGGTFFLKSIDASCKIHDHNFLYLELDKVVEEIGEEHVVQVVSQNGEAYMKAGKLLMQKRKCLIYAPCDSHSINLILTDFAETLVTKSITMDAREVTSFIYSHKLILAFIRKETGGKELGWATIASSVEKEVEWDYEAASLACVEIMTRSPKKDDEILTQIHSKNINRLEQKRLNDLVFVQYNQCLRERFLIRQIKTGDIYEIFDDDETQPPNPESCKELDGDETQPPDSESCKEAEAEFDELNHDDDIKEDFSYVEIGAELVFTTAGDGLACAQLLDENLNFIPLGGLVHDCFYTEIQWSTLKSCHLRVQICSTVFLDLKVLLYFVLEQLLLLVMTTTFLFFPISLLVNVDNIYFVLNNTGEI
ncbi:hypothetical protein RJ639_011144 [Escallonia herrerae]|uniref:DUF659 domain-containing protein n=1 Tax=Escallonia herrerae TaxID=1293975 RepID=A0AA89ARX5_9ASTE|nr:hypothetical protein RJ639_011144 [Escallonia herrerae]